MYATKVVCVFSILKDGREIVAYKPSPPPPNLICEQFVLRASIQVKRSDTSERVGITRVYTPYSLLCGYDPHTDAHQVII